MRSPYRWETRVQQIFGRVELTLDRDALDLFLSGIDSIHGPSVRSMEILNALRAARNELNNKENDSSE